MSTGSVYSVLLLVLLSNTPAVEARLGRVGGLPLRPYGTQYLTSRQVTCAWTVSSVHRVVRVFIVVVAFLFSSLESK